MGSSEQPPRRLCADGGTTKQKRVCYYYDPRISFVDYGETHAMVPHRVSLTHGLIKAYGLLDHMDLLRIAPATEKNLRLAHDANYIDFLRRLTPSGYNDDKQAAEKYKIGELRDKRHRVTNDNPVIENLWDYCRSYAGGSVAAARALASGRYDIAINWSGGMHHACHGEAAGFCYVNDIVVAVETLLAGGHGRRSFRRVLYVDIDAHHGDAVEAAFAGNSRVMTVSFHQYDGEFFPGTVDAVEVEDGDGDGACPTMVNVPLEQGTGDGLYHQLFRPIVKRVMKVFTPDAVVMQCGADSLAGDRLASLGLSVRGHAECVRILRGYGVPLLLLGGGGGYSIHHVASCWCYETAVAIGNEMEISDDIPHHRYDTYYRSQGYKLHYYHKEEDSGDRILENPRARETLKKVMKHLDRLSSKLEPMMPMPSMRPGDVAGQDNDVALDHSARDDEDSVERMHRLCDERLTHKFFTYLGKKKLSTQERQRTMDCMQTSATTVSRAKGTSFVATSRKRRQKRPRRGDELNLEARGISVVGAHREACADGKLACSPGR